MMPKNAGHPSGVQIPVMMRVVVVLLCCQAAAITSHRCIAQTDTTVTAEVTLWRDVYAPADTLFASVAVANHRPVDYTLTLAQPMPCMPFGCIDSGVSLCSDPSAFCPQTVTQYVIPSGGTRLFGYYISFDNLAEGEHTLTTELGELSTPTLSPILSSFWVDRRVLISYSLRRGWNLLSLPDKVNDPSVQGIFHGSESTVFSYDGLGGYTSHDTLQRGVGYWLRVSAPLLDSVRGALVHADTIRVSEGWNLIGSISYPVSVSSISTGRPDLVASKFFGYSDGYFTTDTIYPGFGYWVKVNQEDTLILSTNPTSALVNRIHFAPTPELPPSLPDGSVGGLQSPQRYALAQNYPNPFNPTTSISFSVPTRSHVLLRVYNLLGQLVSTLIDGEKGSGTYSVSWDASDRPSGMYLYRLEAGNFVETRKMVLIK